MTFKNLPILAEVYPVLLNLHQIKKMAAPAANIAIVTPIPTYITVSCLVIPNIIINIIISVL